jgi:hypothetical protein
MVELGELPQEIEMMLAPFDDVLEIVARSDRSAGHQQQNLLDWVGNTPRLPVVVELGEVLQKNGQTSPRALVVHIVSISVLTYQFADTGLTKLLYFLGLLSINLAFINVLPIPVLDGGQMLFLLLEKLKGGRLSERFMNAAQLAGLLAIVALVLYVTYNDITRLVG